MSRHEEIILALADLQRIRTADDIASARRRITMNVDLLTEEAFKSLLTDDQKDTFEHLRETYIQAQGGQ